MADPTEYEPEYSFTGFQAVNPAKPLPAPQVDNELASIATAINGLVGAVKDVRRADGALPNGIVTVDSLGPDVIEALGPNGALITDAVDAAEAAAATATAQATISTTGAATATTKASEASAAAVAAVASAAQAALYEGFWLDDVAAVLADTSLVYGGVTASSVVEGNYVQTREEGYSYEVLASDAVDPPVITAGNINLIPKAGCLTPGMFGVVDNPALLTDQSTKLQRWLTVCAEEFRAPHTDKPIRVLSQDKLYYKPGQNPPSHVNISRMDLSFDFDGGLNTGEVGVPFYSCYFYAPVIRRRGTLTWLADERASRLSGNAGLIFNCPIHSHLFVNAVIGFTNGYVLHSEDRHAAYNDVHIGLVLNCRYAEVLRTVRGEIPGADFANENKFYSGAYRQSSSTTLLGNAYGTVITASDDAYKGNNTSRWYSSCYEMGQPASATYRIPVLLDRAGVYNCWHWPRYEYGKGPFGIADNGSGASSNGACLNSVIYGYFANVAGTDWLQVGGAFGNTSSHANAPNRPKWSSVNMAHLATASGANTARLKAPFFFKSTPSPAPARTAAATGALRANARCLNIVGANAVMVEVDTTQIKTWKLTGAFVGTIGGRPLVQAYDATGALLTGSTTDSFGTEKYVKGLTTTALFGGAYQTAADIADAFLFTVREEVKKIHVGFYGGTNSCALKGFELEGYARTQSDSGGSGTGQAVGVSDPLVYITSHGLTASAKPDTSGIHGFYGDGDIVGAEGATSGTTMGWLSSGGALAPAWAPGTNYLVPGTVAINDSGKVYELMTPGTSASSGGPTGTGASISDGAAVWRYLCPKAVFAPLPVLP